MQQRWRVDAITFLSGTGRKRALISSPPCKQSGSIKAGIGTRVSCSHRLANVYYAQGKYAEAAELHKRALAIREKALGPTFLVRAIPSMSIGLSGKGDSLEGG